MDCHGSLEIKLAACVGEYYLEGFEPNQPYRISLDANGVYVVKDLLADATGIITLKANEYPAGWFNAHRFLMLRVNAAGLQLYFKKDDTLFLSLILAMTTFMEHTPNETKITGEWVYS